MKKLDKAIRKTELALSELNRVKADASDETALLFAHDDLEKALSACSGAFAELGYAAPDAAA